MSLVLLLPFYWMGPTWWVSLLSRCLVSHPDENYLNYEGDYQLANLNQSPILSHLRERKKAW